MIRRSSGAADDLEREYREACEHIREALPNRTPVRRNLPLDGRIEVDRPLPFLCVYRRGLKNQSAGDERLVTAQASFLIAPSQTEFPIREVVRAVLEPLSQMFPAVLLLEVWIAVEHPEETPHAARFTIYASPRHADDSATQALAKSLEGFSIGQMRVPVRVEETDEVAPEAADPILNQDDAAALNCVLLGLECPPLYRDSTGEISYPLVLRDFRHRLSEALQRGFFAFSAGDTPTAAATFETMATSSVSTAAAAVDRQLYEISSSFDFLLYATPINGEAAWEDFRKRGCNRAPVFRYRPLPFDPRALKRQLYSIPLDDVEDPVLWQIFAEKQDELDRQITLLADRGKPIFRYGSVQLYGLLDQDLLDAARDVLSRTEKDDDEAEPAASEPRISVDEIAELSQSEIAHYQRQDSNFEAHVEIRDDLAAGMMVSGGRLLISKNVTFAQSRVEALLHHEIGTHLLTFFNGRAQPLKQLEVGLAGYETLQEGLAVLAEYLSGGLRKARVRTLAVRVEAANALMSGAKFMDTFHLLRDQYGYSSRTSFRITTRIYRGGGLTKDAAYLRGLRQVLRFLSECRDIERLLVGKIALHHLPWLETLARRQIVRPPRLLPRYLEQPDAKRRLENCQNLTLSHLLNEVTA